MTVNIWWIRRDLRLRDNPALHAANNDAIIPLFIVDPYFDASTYVGDKRRAFLNANLKCLDQDLRQIGGRMIIRQGDPHDVLQTLLAETAAGAIFAQEDVTPYARMRDDAIGRDLPLHLTSGLTIHPPDAVRKADGLPYSVYTPYSKAWRSLPPPEATHILSAPGKVTVPAGIDSLPLPSEPTHPEDHPFPPGEHEALRRLRAFLEGDDAAVFSYSEGRDRVDLEGTSRLSPYLRFGLISPRQAAVAAWEALARAKNESARQAAQTWLNELIWREFFVSILTNYPEVRSMSFRQDMRAIAWRNDQEEFEAWKRGQTGYPIVDAAMRQLLSTGWMHNRARMITASFLVKDLLIDWRWGERWFMQHLIDGDPAANNGGWQWTAGTGTDAAPYFRVFNPILQSKKSDPAGEYIRRWLPELANLPTTLIHTPWQMDEAAQQQYGARIGVDYPFPIIDHAFARQRALDAYKRVRR